MITKWKVFVLITCCLFPLQSYADELLSVKAGYQLLSPEGSIAGTVLGDSEEFDLERDLNLDDSEDFTGEVALQLGHSRLSLNYLPIGFSGTGTLSRSVTFNGTTYNIGTAVKSDLSVDLYDIGYTYYLLNFDDLPMRFQLGFELAVKVADVDVSIKDLTTGVTETVSGTAPIPTIGARTRIALADFLGISGRIGYLELNDNHFLDAEAQVEFSPLPMVGLYAGVRIFDLKIDEDDINIETEFSGPFGGLMVRF
ncbi:MAG: hypothetical protein JXQ81_12325 [Desulfuromonadales bacterium]|nr:hypothetical protein [Desulfuromonadales bacterium]MBN2793286.1 hypothetical protein [Desulfuromonadales bacterium]